MIAASTDADGIDPQNAAAHSIDEALTEMQRHRRLAIEARDRAYALPEGGKEYRAEMARAEEHAAATRALHALASKMASEFGLYSRKMPS